MASETPSWLDKEFIRNAIQDGKDSNENGSITVDSIKVDRPIAKGDNYVCEILRVDVEYRTSDSKEPLRTSLILKVPLVGGMADVLLTMGVLEKEVKFYNEYVPKMRRIIGADRVITAKSFFSSRENVVVLEDLKFKGYLMADRQAQLDYNHTVIALKTLAEFHAASVRLHEDEPEFVEELGHEVLFGESCHENNKEFARVAFKLMADEAKNCPKLERYTEQLLGYSENAWDILIELVKPQEGAFNVLNHGDFWVNNMLFHYDESKKPDSVMLLDLQISRYARPTLDIFYLIYSSVKEEVRIKHLDVFITIYLDELNRNLETFGSSQRLTRSELNSMLDETEFFAMLTCVWLYPIVSGDPKDGVMQLSEVTEDDFKSIENNPFRHYYKNKRVLNVIGERFTEFERKGWF